MLRWITCSLSQQTYTLLQAKMRQGMCCRPSWMGNLLQAMLGQARQVQQNPTSSIMYASTGLCSWHAALTA